MKAAKKHAKRARLFLKQHGRCYWCQGPMVLARDRMVIQPHNLATFEHLDDRLSPDRGKHSGEIRVVLACRRCNHARGADRVKALPIWIRHQDSGRYPMPSELVSALESAD